MHVLSCSAAGRWLLGLTLGFVWMGVSSGLIILNKQLMSKDGFHYPMALSALGMSFSSVASYFCCRVSVSTARRGPASFIVCRTAMKVT